MNRFIVAEVSKNWTAPGRSDTHELLCQQFERVIAFNLERGYLLHSFQLHQMMPDRERMVETIIAVFESVYDQAGTL